MAAVKDFQPAVRKYLEQLELELKKLPGVVPEEALSDAREFLVEDADALQRSGEPPAEREHFQWIVERYGAPDFVAQQYARDANPFPIKRGYAPGWRICCTQCGRSAPLASIGAIRIGAKSWHKYQLGFCRGCNRLRFLRIIQDLEKSNLTEQLGNKHMPAEVRSTMHRPVTAILGILSAVAISIGITLACLFWAAQAGAQSPKSNDEAIHRLRRAIELDYSYADLHGIDWSRQFDPVREEHQTATSPESFATVAAKCLVDAKDSHIWFKVGEKIIGTYQHQIRPNFNPRILPKLIPSLTQHGKTVLVGTTSEKIRYIAIATWDHRDPDSMAKAVDAVQNAARQQQRLILDVRANSGGDEMQARKVASYFVSKPTPYASHSTRSDGKNGDTQQRVLQPDADGLFHPGPCVVLMGQANMSACESFLLMMRAAGVRLIGEKSIGTSGNPKPHDLGNGVSVFLPSWREMDLQGNLIEGTGIQPDITTQWKPEDFSRSDPVLLEAIKQLTLTSSTRCSD